MTESADQIRRWRNDVRDASNLRLTKVPFAECKHWQNRRGRLAHESGRFFSITGLRVSDAGESLLGTDQVMIDQPEVGWLGFLVRPGREGLEWLLQAKTEPGNIGATHLAPSIQATRSNYQRAHGGQATRFLDVFRTGRSFASDAPHSEQGTKFLWKFNRNSVLILPDIDIVGMVQRDHWRWCPCAVMRDLLSDDYGLNSDARSVIVTAPWALLADGRALFSADVLAASYGRAIAAAAFQDLRKRIRPTGPAMTPRWLELDPLDLDGWHQTETDLHDEAGRAAVSCFEVDVLGREVRTWCQPFLMPVDPSDLVLFLRLTPLGAEVFLRSYQEVGFGQRRELGPSRHSAFRVPDDMRDWDAPASATELIRLNQSDEGGRFFQADATYRIVLVRSAPARVQYPFGQWVSLAALEQIVQVPGATTNELRSLVSLLLSNKFDQVCRSL